MSEANERPARGHGSPATRRAWWSTRRERSGRATVTNGAPSPTPVGAAPSVAPAAHSPQVASSIPAETPVGLPVPPDPAASAPSPAAPTQARHATSPRRQLLDQLSEAASKPHSVDDVRAATNTEQRLSLLLAGVRQAIPGLTGSLIASDEGLPICHDFSESDAETVAAMAAVALSLATRITGATGMGPLLETVVRAMGGYFVVYAAGPSAVLVLAGPPSVNLGAMRIEARALSAHVSEILR